MKKYNIVVNGVAYEVEVEEVGGAAAPAAPAPQAAPAPAPAAPAPAPAPAPKAAPAPAPAAAPAGGADTITAPMPGTVLDVKVKEGDTVPAGATLLILEAMKMENEIQTLNGGVVDKVYVGKGASVNTGDVLVSMK
ncbi:MAG: biotin/lipoyl-containing protein [Bacillota bacterium]|nr:biotin/lipoyl-containing protein [Bacillota bacterium]